MKPTPPADTTWLYLVRHGATEANERRPYILQGRGVNHGLSATGRQQAEAAGRFLAEFAVDAVYSSCLRRAHETAQAIAAPHRLEVEQIDDLAECHVGHWEGKDWETIRREYPAEHQAFLDDPADVPYFGGESYNDVLRRVHPIFARLLERHRGRAVVVVGHNVVNRAWLGSLLGLDPRRAKDLRQANGGINVIHHRDGQTQLVTLNACFHVPGALH